MYTVWLDVYPYRNTLVMLDYEKACDLAAICCTETMYTHGVVSERFHNSKKNGIKYKVSHHMKFLVFVYR